MRFVTMRLEGRTAAGRVEGDRVVELDWPDVGAMVASGTGWESTAAAAEGTERALDEVDLAPVVPAPGKVLCLGLNYANHIKEMGHELPEWPTVFAKFADTLTGPRDTILLPRESERVDWEVELAFVIGRPARRVSEADAPACIAGFTVLNDVSMRDWQRRTSQFLQGKMFEASTPVGPALVTPDEVDGAADLALRCEVDGEVMQEARTSDLLFGPAHLVAYLSQITTLRPGDIVSTGTPGGVGAGRTPPVFLSAGQVLTTTIEGLGTLRNTFVADKA